MHRRARLDGAVLLLAAIAVAAGVRAQPAEPATAAAQPQGAPSRDAVAARPSPDAPAPASPPQGRASASSPERDVPIAAEGVARPSTTVSATLVRDELPRLAVGILAPSPVRADAALLVEPISHTRFAREPVLDSKPFVCLGSGIRRRAFFKLYAISFCVERAGWQTVLAHWFERAGRVHAGKRGEALAAALADDPEFYRLLVQAPVEKASEIVFLRDVSADRLRESFSWSLDAALGPEYSGRIASFVSLVQQDLQKGDRLQIRTAPDGTLRIGVETLRALEDERIVYAIWQTWFGPGSPSPPLKESVARGVAEAWR